jgi:hypothetical protein
MSVQEGAHSAVPMLMAEMLSDRCADLERKSGKVSEMVILHGAQGLKLTHVPGVGCTMSAQLR